MSSYIKAGGNVLGTPPLIVAAGSYNPVTALGAKLIAYWEANRADLITIATGIASWRDVVAGYDMVQAVGANQPIWSAVSYNGQPGVTFDGVAQQLTCTDAALLLALPLAAVAGEIWVLVEQTALPADVAVRYICGYQATNQTGRDIGRQVSLGINRTRVSTGDGAVLQSTPGTVVDFSGRHVVRDVIGAGNSSLTTDGVADAVLAVLPATAALRSRIGALPAAGAVNFWQGQIAAVLYTTGLTAGEASALQTYLMGRV